MRVLIVDDQKIPRVTVGAILSDAGYTVKTAASGAEGLERARSWLPDVVVLDVQMPGMDGFQVVEHLKQDAETAPIPVIFLTAESPTDDLVVRGLELGAYDFLNKGCSRAELLARVGAMARIKRSHDEMAALAGLSDVLLQTLDPAEMADRLIGQVTRTFRADAALLVLPGTTDSPDVRASLGFASDGAPFFHLVDTLLDQIHAANSTSDVVVLQDALHVDSQAEFAFNSTAVAYVRRAEQRPLLLGIFSRSGKDFQHPGEARLLGMLAQQATLALDNAILHTAAREQAKTLERQATQLERAMTERSRFFASMSHELRTPINAILGYSELLTDGLYGVLEEKQQHAAERVVGSARHLLDLVNDVLDISKLEAGKIEVVPEPTDLAALLRDIVTSVQLQAEAKGLDLVVDAPGPARITTDPGRVRQIVLNLLSNAVKFTDEGTIRLSLHLAPHWAEVQVSDTGPGVPPEDRDRIFSEFEQTGFAAARGGTGLGLAISRRLAQLLGGSLHLQSTVGEGSTFVLQLPLGRGEAVTG